MCLSGQSEHLCTATCTGVTLVLTLKCSAPSERILKIYIDLKPRGCYFGALSEEKLPSAVAGKRITELDRVKVAVLNSSLNCNL